MATIKPQFHERQYDFCANADLVNNVGALIAGYIPGIPSPRQEGELGWDASVVMPSYGRTFLLQYKTARLTTARAGPNAKFWDAYHAPYFRFSLHLDRLGSYTQHRLLVESADIGMEPLYCAPSFSETSALIGALRDKSVLDRSVLIPVDSLGPVVDGVAHSVTFPVDPADGPPIVHSEQRRGERVTFDDAIRRRPEARQLDVNVFDQFTSRVREGRVDADWVERTRVERRVRAEDPRAEAFLLAAVVAEVDLNATLVVIPADS